MLECLDPHSTQRGPGEVVILSHIRRGCVKNIWSGCMNSPAGLMMSSINGLVGPIVKIKIILPKHKWARLKFHEVLLSMVVKCIHV